MNTLEKLNKHLKGKIIKRNNYSFKEILPRVKCRNGLSLSIQASKTHDCKPREDKPELGYYTHVEVGFPSRKLEKLKNYAEEPKYLTETVYSYVPIAELVEVINDFGGFKDA